MFPVLADHDSGESSGARLWRSWPGNLALQGPCRRGGIAVLRGRDHDAALQRWFSYSGHGSGLTIRISSTRPAMAAACWASCCIPGLLNLLDLVAAGSRMDNGHGGSCRPGASLCGTGLETWPCAWPGSVVRAYREAGYDTGNRGSASRCQRMPTFRKASRAVDRAGVHSFELAAGRDDLHHHRPGGVPLLWTIPWGFTCDVHPGVRSRAGTVGSRRRRLTSPAGGSSCDGPERGVRSLVLGSAALAGLLRRGPGLPRSACGLAAGSRHATAFYLAIALGGFWAESSMHCWRPWFSIDLIEYPLAMVLAAWCAGRRASRSKSSAPEDRLSDLILPVIVFWADGDSGDRPG